MNSSLDAPWAFPPGHRYQKFDRVVKLKRGWRCKRRLIRHLVGVLNVRAFLFRILTEYTGVFA